MSSLDFLFKLLPWYVCFSIIRYGWVQITLFPSYICFFATIYCAL